jgi:hypothetical protein
VKDLEDPSIVPFVVLWMLLCLSGFLFSILCRNSSLKKKVFVVGYLVGDLVFLGFLAWVGFPLVVLVFVVPFVALVTIFSIWSTKFCPRCGRTITNAYLLQFCPRCGEPLARKEPGPPGAT